MCICSRKQLVGHLSIPCTRQAEFMICVVINLNGLFAIDVIDSGRKVNEAC